MLFEQNIAMIVYILINTKRGPTINQSITENFGITGGIFLMINFFMALWILRNSLRSSF